MLYSVLNSKQKQLHGHKANKMGESTLSWIGKFEEKIYLSHIYLAVKANFLYVKAFFLCHLKLVALEQTAVSA